MTNKTNLILVSGTGKMGTALMKGLFQDSRYKLCDFAITESGSVKIGQEIIMGVTPDERSEMLVELTARRDPFIIIDAVPASASQANAEYYSRFENLPVIIMSTGIKDFSRIKNTLVLPNACLPILAWEKFLTSLDEDLFEGVYSLEILESHQKTKQDVSGTARKFIPHFNRLGFGFNESQIVSLRDDESYRDLGIPKEFYGAHGFHQYSLISSKRDDAYLKYCFFEEAVDYFRENPLFQKLFFYDEPALKKRGRYEKVFNWWNVPFDDNHRYGTFMFTVKLTLAKDITRVDVSHCVFGHQAYVDGMLDYALPFMQQQCKSGLTGANFSSLDLYDYAMKE